SYRVGIFHQKRLKGAVVSVGNLTVGGTGKTPMVAWLAKRFSEAGARTAVLCRGYRPLPRRSEAGDDPRIAEGWNDETALLHGRLGSDVELGANANRYEKGRELEDIGVECFVLDDGFQHLQLARDVDIVMVDATNPFGGGHVLPAGRLREPVSALRRADIIVITRSDHAPAVEAVVRRYSEAPIMYAQTELVGIEPYGADLNSPVEAAREGKKIFAFCGIGNPAAFLDDLKRWGLSVVGHAKFRDHYFYAEHDVANLEAQAAAVSADALVCTEKDIYDLMPLRTKRIPIHFCKISLRINEEERLWHAIVEMISRRKPGALR
ncbi:MAG: tetraacyldisaccharide 4'-kinase, partial [Candidatus Acidiferrales bacterium]